MRVGVTMKRPETLFLLLLLLSLSPPCLSLSFSAQGEQFFSLSLLLRRPTYPQSTVYELEPTQLPREPYTKVLFGREDRLNRDQFLPLK